MVADDARLMSTKEQIARTMYKYTYHIEDNMRGDAQIVPVLYKKPSKSRKSRQVDIQINIDMMRFAQNPNIGLLYLISGDGDYLPLLQRSCGMGRSFTWRLYLQDWRPNFVTQLMSFSTSILFSFPQSPSGREARPEEKRRLTNRCRQQPPRRAVDRFMILEHHRCRPRPAPEAVPELYR